MDLEWIFKRVGEVSSSDTDSNTSLVSENGRSSQNRSVSIEHTHVERAGNNPDIHEHHGSERNRETRRIIPFLFPTLGDLPGLLVASPPGSIFQHSQWKNIRKRYIKTKGADQDGHLTANADHEKKVFGLLHPGARERRRGKEAINPDGNKQIRRIPVTLDSHELISLDELELDDTGFSEHQVMPDKLDAFLSSHNQEADLGFESSTETIQLTDENVKTAYYRGIYVTIFLLGLIVFTYAVGATIFFVRSMKPGMPYTCRTPNCQRMANWIKNAMNPKVNPCDDFYHFACGNYIKTHPVSQETEDPNEIHLYRDGLPTNYKENEKIGNFLKKAKNFPDNQLLPYYQACIDMRRRNKHGVKPLVHLLARIALFTPQSGAFYSVISKLNIGRVMGSIYRKTNKLFFFDFEEVKDDMILIKVAKPPQEIILTPPKAYANAMKRCWQAFSKDLLIEDPDEIDTIVYLVMRFEAEVGIIQSKESENYIFGFPIHFDEQVPPPAKFHSNYLKMRGRFEWDELIAAFMEYTPGNYPEFRYSINLWSSFYSKQDRYYALYLVDKLRNTPSYVIFRYFQWGLMKLFAFELNKEIQDIMLTIFRTSGQTVVERCFRSVFSNLHILAAHRFKSQITDIVSIHNNMTTITDVVFQTFTDTVSKLELPAAIKTSLLATSRTLKIVLVDPNSELDAHLNIYYKVLNCSKEHFPNVVQAKSIKARNKVKLATKTPPFDKWWDGEYSLTEWTETTSADAYTTTRYLRVPFAAIQEPYLGNDLPILNYAGFGHFGVSLPLLRFAFDDLFQVYESNLRIWEPKDEVVVFKDFQKAFLATTECIISAQSSLRLKEFPEFKVNPDNRETRMRMFAHTFALELIDLVIEKLTKAKMGSVYPYKSFMDELLHANEMIGKRFPTYQLLPGLEKYSPNQLAFLSMARQHCQTYTKQKAASQMTNGPLLTEILMHGSMRNLRQFAEIWKCPKDSFMNPRRRCTLLTGDQENLATGNQGQVDELERDGGEHITGTEHYYDESEEENSE